MSRLYLSNFVCKPAFITLCLASSLLAQWKSNGIAVCDTIISGGQALLPNAAPDGKGGAFVVWRDARNGSDYDIYAQHIDSNGTMLWAKNGIPLVQAPYNQNFPRVCSDDEGGAFFAWEDDRSLLHTNVYAQRVDRNGQILWPVNGLKAADTSGEFIAMAPDGKSGLLLAFAGLSGSQFDVFAQRLDSAGNRVWGDSAVHVSSRPENVTSNDVSIVKNDSGGGIIAWIEGDGTYAQRLDRAGTPLWATNGVSLSNTSMYSRFAVGMVSDLQGGAFVTWTKNPNTGVFLQRINSQGQTMFADTGLYIGYGGTAGNIVSDGTGGVIVLLGSGPNTLQLHRINADGVDQWSGGRTVSRQFGIMEISLASDGASGGFVVWSKIDSNEMNIYGQWIDSTGAARFGPDGTTICQAPHVQQYPVVVNAANIRAITLWNDSRTTDPYKYWGVFAAKLERDGVVDVKDENVTIPESDELMQNYPNPFNPETTIEYTLHSRGYVRIEVLNLLGQRVDELVDEVQEAGEHQIRWRPKSLPTGIYFCRLSIQNNQVIRKLVLLK